MSELTRFIAWEDITYHPEEEKEKDTEGFDEEDDKPNLGLENMMITPFGMYSIKSKITPMNDRVALLANTNFTLTEELVNKVSLVDGLEAIRVFSKYCFSIIIGVMFNVENVVEDIEKVLNVQTPKIEEIIESSEEFTELANRLIEDLNKASKHWILYIFPNGEHWSETYDSEEDYQKYYSKFLNDDENLTKYSSGVLFNSKNLAR